VPVPSAPASLARGFLAVAGTPAIPLTAFPAVLALWVAYTSSRVVTGIPPGALAQLLSLPPLHSLVDLEYLIVVGRAGTTPTLAVGAAVLVGRSLLLTLWVVLLADALGTRDDGTERLPLPPRVRRAFAPVLAFETGFLFLVNVASVLGALLGLVGVVAALAAVMYFFVFGPIVAATEDGGIRRCLRLALGTARVQGSRHLVLVLIYLLLALTLLSVTPTGRVVRATPSIPVWLYALAAGVLHLTVLGALTHRWLRVREAVLELERPSERPAPSGLR
jgi:hypothetical protein